MIKLDYRVISEGNVLCEAKGVNISFMDWCPAESANQANVIFPNILNNHNSEFDGYFTLSVDPVVEKGQEELIDIFKTLLLCEKENKKVSILVKVSESNPELTTTNDFITIFNNCNIYHVNKITRLEKDNKFATMIFMLYKF